jgi:cobalt transporter subunit CbtA
MPHSPLLKRMMASVLLAGLISGMVLTAVQKVQVGKIILQAEVYEEAAAAAAAALPAAPDVTSHGTAAQHAQDPAHEHEHEHEHGGWQPGNGLQRTLFTALANVTMGIGFALLLAAAIVLRGGVADWRTGLAWGLAGYAVFFVAPALGLPPEVPGTAAAPLADRQLWWLLAAASSAAGLALLAFNRRRGFRLLGALLLALPHLIGAPQPAVHGSAAPAELARAFIYASALANLAFWLTLGGLLACFYKKFSR